MENYICKSVSNLFTILSYFREAGADGGSQVVR